MKLHTNAVAYFSVYADRVQIESDADTGRRYARKLHGCWITRTETLAHAARMVAAGVRRDYARTTGFDRFILSMMQACDMDLLRRMVQYIEENVESHNVISTPIEYMKAKNFKVYPFNSGEGWYGEDDEGDQSERLGSLSDLLALCSESVAA